MPVWSLALIPVVIAFLWLLFRSKQKHKHQQSTLSSEYFKGLNYLLNDEQGKALDIFVKLVESNWDTIDMHFTLGNYGLDLLLLLGPRSESGKYVFDEIIKR